MLAKDVKQRARLFARRGSKFHAVVVLGPTKIGRADAFLVELRPGPDWTPTEVDAWDKEPARTWACRAIDLHREVPKLPPRIDPTVIQLAINAVCVAERKLEHARHELLQVRDGELRGREEKVAADSGWACIAEATEALLAAMKNVESVKESM